VALQAYGAGLGVQRSYSFTILCPGEAIHELGVQSADVQLSLVLYLSQVCLQPLSKVPGSRRSGVCGCVPVAILDLSKVFL
jgi:hypothetical protein